MNYEIIALFAAITLGLTQVVKSWLPTNKDGSYKDSFQVFKRKFHWGQLVPTISLGIAIGVVAVFTNLAIKETIALGVLAGLTASGFFSNGKALLPKTADDQIEK